MKPLSIVTAACVFVIFFSACTTQEKSQQATTDSVAANIKFYTHVG